MLYQIETTRKHSARDMLMYMPERDQKHSRNRSTSSLELFKTTSLLPGCSPPLPRLTSAFESAMLAFTTDAQAAPCRPRVSSVSGKPLKDTRMSTTLPSCRKSSYITSPLESNTNTCIPPASETNSNSLLPPLANCSNSATAVAVNHQVQHLKDAEKAENQSQSQNPKAKERRPSFEVTGVPELDERELFKHFSALLTEVDGVLSVGGDGTLGEVVHGLLMRARHLVGLADDAHTAHSLEIQPSLPVGMQLHYTPIHSTHTSNARCGMLIPLLLWNAYSSTVVERLFYNLCCYLFCFLLILPFMLLPLLLLSSFFFLLLLRRVLTPYFRLVIVVVVAFIYYISKQMHVCFML